MANPEYTLESSDAERERLRSQAQALRLPTERLFRAAGIGPGMSVLDVGCGVGDVALLAAELVGPTGSVVGFDRDPAQVAAAAARAPGPHVTFTVAEIDQPPPGQFDAVVGRLVLMYQPDMAVAVQGLAARLRPGGVMAFIESNNRHDAVVALTWPVTPFQDKVHNWILQAFAATGTQPYAGIRLPGLYRLAGLEPQPPYEVCGAVYEGRASAEMTAAVVRAMLPVLERQGVDPADVDIDTLADRILADAGSERVVALPMVAAWARKPES